MFKLKFFGIALAAVLALCGQQARADMITIDLSSPNTAISGYTGPYAQVQIDLTTSTTATITFTSLTNSGNIYLMGDGSTVGLNVNAATFTAGTVTGTNGGTGFTPGPFTKNFGSQNVDGFGAFNFTIDSFDGFGHSSDTVSFTLTNTSASWASASDVLTTNSNGSEAVAHIFVTSSPANASNTALATGYAANGGAVSVPEPASLATICIGLATVGGFGLYRRRKS